MASLSLEVCFSPSVEELSLDLFVSVEPDQVLVFVVLMDKVHGVSVPSSQRVSFSFCCIVPHHFDELVNSLFQVLHVLGTALDLLESVFRSHIQSLPKHLE